jgi:hypothetical protein
MPIQLKRSLTSGSLPTTASLVPGELALNVPDGRIFLRKSGSTDTIQSAITTGAQNSGSIALTGSLSLYSATGSVLDVSGDVVSIDGDIVEIAADTMEFTGSFITSGSVRVVGNTVMSGSLNISGSVSVFNNEFTVQPTGVTIGNIITDRHTITGSLAVSGSITGSLSGSITGSLFGTSSWATNVVNAPNSFPYTGSAIITGSIVLTGSAYGNVSAITVASNTASFDIRSANFFTVTMGASSVTHFNVTNPSPGQTVSILVRTNTASTASFSSNIRQVTGSLYTPSVSGSNDILTFVTFDSTNVFMTSLKRLS